MIKAISYCLFGDKPLYLQGALRNAELAPKFYSGWVPIFYCEKESVPSHIITGLMERGARVRPYSRMEFPNGMFKRFCIADDPDVERFMVRDVDSRPSQRERNAVEAWIQSGRSFHIMRDHPWHASLLMGGLWGGKRGILKNVGQSIKRFSRAKFVYNRETQYGADQDFLVQFVWPKARTDSLIHDSFRVHGLTGEPFPDGTCEGDFVGSIFSETDEPNIEHINVRNEWIKTVHKSL